MMNALHSGASSSHPIRPQTLAQKVIARAAQQSHVEVGSLLNCQVDLAMFHDSSGPRRLAPMLKELGVGIWDKNKVVLVMDHYVPARDEESRAIVQLARETAKVFGLAGVSAKARARLDEAVPQLVASGRASRDGDRLRWSG